MGEYYTYILYSPSFKKTSVGQTNNLESRFVRHTMGMVSSTKRYKPWIIVHYEQYQSRAEAMERERYWKSGAGREELKCLLAAKARTANASRH